MASPVPQDIMSFQTTLASSRHIIAVAGAGLSAASGIPTFRGVGGYWRKYNAMSLATLDAFKANPSLVWQFYHYRRESALRAKPNAAHETLASFSLPSVRHRVAPGSTFTLITQNVDGLSVISLETTKSQADPQEPHNSGPDILQMHGNLFDVACTNASCGHVDHNTTSPICAGLAGTETLVEEGVLDPDIPLTALPCCSKCGALARPGVVWFGEIPKHLPEIEDLANQADLCLVVGTSSTVYPAAGIAYDVAEHGGKVAIFNLERTEGDEDADWVFRGPCEELLPKALGLTA